MGDTRDAFPVIRISLNSSRSDSPEILEASLFSVVEREALRHQIILNATVSSSALAELILKLSLRHKTEWLESGKDSSVVDLGNVVVLIDENDYPLISEIENPDNHSKIRLNLRNFFSTLKSCSNFFRFVLITGVTKFRELSLFSALNTAWDITLETKFTKICGLSIDEIKNSFSKYLVPTLSALINNGQLGTGSSVADLLNIVKDWYNGYTWDKESDVLNPYSVMKFFMKQRLENYWYKTGPSLLTSRLSQNGNDYLMVFSNDLSFNDSLPEMSLNGMNDTVLLMQAGYLTVCDITESGDSMEYHLKIPNKEVRDSIRLELLTLLLVPARNILNSPHYLNKKYLQFLDAFATRDEDKCELFLSSIFAGIIQRGPVIQASSDSTDINGVHIGSFILNEFFFRSMLQLLLEFGNKLAIHESFSDIGRSDLAVQVSGNGWVALEIKHEKADPAHKGSDVSLDGETIVIGERSEYVNDRLDKMISAAFVQIININYAKKYLADGVDVYAAAVAVYGTSDFMVRFKKIVWREGEGSSILLV
ncbi:MAG: AAA family ATPase [Deltaproteobacteria bacterium]|jgi:hypothetical protein|nr:AAA family ATPase [Deltaproteobacteria bacterium]